MCHVCIMKKQLWIMHLLVLPSRNFLEKVRNALAFRDVKSQALEETHDFTSWPMVQHMACK